MRLSALEELFQAEQWGEDEEAAKRRRQVAADMALAERFIRLAGEGCDRPRQRATPMSVESRSGSASNSAAGAA